MQHRFNGDFTVYELEDLLGFLKQQETSDRITNTEISLTGEVNTYFIRINELGFCDIYIED